MKKWIIESISHQIIDKFDDVLIRSIRDTTFRQVPRSPQSITFRLKLAEKCNTISYTIEAD